MILKKKEFFLLIFLILLQSCSGGRIGNFLESSFNDLEKTSQDEDLQNNLVNKKIVEKENKEINVGKDKKIKEAEKPKNAPENKKDINLEKITIDDAVSLLEEKLKDKKGSILKKTKIINKKTNRKTKS